MARTTNTSRLILQGEDKTKKSVKSAKTGFTSLGASIARTTGLITAAYAAVASTGKIVSATNSLQNMENRLRLVAGAGGDVEKTQQRLFDIALRTRQPVKDLAETYARLGLAAEASGIPLQALENVVETIGKASAISGATAVESANAIRQFTQGFQSGRFAGEELRSVLEQLPRLAVAIADGMDVPVGQLREMGKRGELIPKQIYDALVKQGPKIQKEFEKMQITLDQAATNIQTALLRALDEWVVNSGAAGDIAESLNTLAMEINEIAGATFYTLGLSLVDNMSRGISVGILEAAAAMSGSDFLKDKAMQHDIEERVSNRQAFWNAEGKGEDEIRYDVMKRYYPEFVPKSRKFVESTFGKIVAEKHFPVGPPRSLMNAAEMGDDKKGGQSPGGGFIGNAFVPEDPEALANSQYAENLRKKEAMDEHARGQAILAAKTENWQASMEREREYLEGRDALLEELGVHPDSEYERLEIWRQQQQEHLDATYTIKAHHEELTAALEASYRDKKAELDAKAAAKERATKAKLYNDLLGIAAAFGKKGQKIARAITAAQKTESFIQAFLSIQTGAANALKDKPFPLNLIAFAAVVAKGVIALNAIKSVGGGGGGSVGSVSSGGSSFASTGSQSSFSSPPADDPERRKVVNVKVARRGNFIFTAEEMRDFAEQLADTLGDSADRIDLTIGSVA